MNIGRSSGILLHITSLPGRFGIGDLGPESRRFVDILEEARQKLWCILPLGPAGEENSPYRSPSAFAGNAMMISPELLAEQGYVSNKDLRFQPRGRSSHVDFPYVQSYKESLLKKAFQGFSETKSHLRFVRRNAWWLDRYSLFMALREANGGIPWTKFDAKVKPDPACIQYHKFVQYEFFRQWQALHEYCKKRSIAIMGDMSFYVEHDSADVWNNAHLFDLRENGEPASVGGVPPDYFSKDGQLWGTPTYRWDRMKAAGFKWWIDRFRAAFAHLDLLRLDHFRGFEAYWSVPSNQRTARKGRWKKGPGAQLFDVAHEKFGKLPIVAENLGVITKEVEKLRMHCGFPGMAVLQFGFDDEGFHRPDNYTRKLVCFTGTHDNDTTIGWWNALMRATKNPRASAERETVRRVKCYLQSNGEQIHWSFIRALLTSVAEAAVIPMQDVLGLGSEARMNLPGHAKGNWGWRVTRTRLSGANWERLRDLTIATGR